MSPADRLAVEVEDAMERVPPDSITEVVAEFVAVVAAATERAYLALLDFGLEHDAIGRILGIPPEKPRPPVH